MEENNINTEGAQVGHKFTKVKIDVTKEIIETAVPQNSSHCMIADAVKAACAQRKIRISKVLVDLATIRFTDLKTGTRYTCLTPKVGQAAIQQFDYGIKPEPFSFRLKPAQISERHQRAQRATATTPRHGPSKPRVVAPKKDGYGSPVVIGGPPLAISIGLRREFGIRQLGLPPGKPAESQETAEVQG